MKSTDSISTLLFDWDGTLADSAHLGLAAFQKTFAELGVSFGVDINKKDLGNLRDLAESGKIVPALTKTYPLTETAAAYKYLETGHVQGKIAITIE